MDASTPSLEVREDTLAGLIARLTEGTGPDHVLDWDVIAFLHGYTLHERSDPTNGYAAFWDGEPWKSTCHNCSSWSNLTSDLADALTWADGLESRTGHHAVDILPIAVADMTTAGWRPNQPTAPQLARWVTFRMLACLRGPLPLNGLRAGQGVGK